MYGRIYLPFALILNIVLAGCAGTAKEVGDKEYGEVSFYADKYQGRTTASGERFDQNGMTAAHKTLPFGSKVKITNRANSRSVVVRINDRGPFVRGRIVDLSKTAFGRIADHRLGVIEVELVVLGRVP